MVPLIWRGVWAQMLRLIGKLFVSALVVSFATNLHASPTLEDSILVSSTYLESAVTSPRVTGGLSLGVESPVTFIPSDDSLGSYATRRPPVASVPGIWLGYGMEHASGVLWGGALSLGRMRLNEDPFGNVKNFKYDASRIGVSLGASKQLESVLIGASFGSQWNRNRICGGLIEDDIISVLNTSSQTKGWTLESSYKGFIFGGSVLSRTGTAEFKIFDEGTSIVVDQNGSLPLRTWAIGYGTESFRLVLERTILQEVASFYQLNYRHVWTFDI